jgi:hypothetical protein
MERLNQPSRTECCRGKGQGALPDGRGDRTMSLKRTQGTLRAVRGERTSLKQFSLVTNLEQVETLFNSRNPKRTDRQGEVWEGLSGSKSMARKEREVRNLGGPLLSRHSNCEIQPGKMPQRQGEGSTEQRESDRLILAGKEPKASNRRRGRRDGVTRGGNRSSTNG